LQPIYADDEIKISRTEAHIRLLATTTIITTTIVGSILESVFIRAVVILNVSTFPLNTM